MLFDILFISFVLLPSCDFGEGSSGIYLTLKVPFDVENMP